MNTLHEVQDPAKVEQLAADIARNGWQGAPLVCWGDWLITGVHRYAACRLLEMQTSEIPTIDLEDLFAAADLDMDALHARWDCPTVGEDDFIPFLHELPASLREEYGIDLH